MRNWEDTPVGPVSPVKPVAPVGPAGSHKTMRCIVVAIVLHMGIKYAHVSLLQRQMLPGPG